MTSPAKRGGSPAEPPGPGIIYPVIFEPVTTRSSSPGEEITEGSPDANHQRTSPSAEPYTAIWPTELNDQPSYWENGTPYSPLETRETDPLDAQNAQRPSSKKYWPFPSQSEAFLVRHFVINLSRWLDYGAAQRTFETSVVRLAVTRPPLMLAILALSACHLSRGSDCNKEAANQYYRQCLDLLIPLLEYQSAVIDDATYAAIVILRLFEDIADQCMGRCLQSGFLGTHTFILARKYHELSDVGQAVFHVILRQEILVAFRTRRPVRMLDDFLHVDRSMTGANDWTSTFHVLALCAEILNFCYEEDAKTLDAWDHLASRTQSWANTKPTSFEPMYREPAQATQPKVFPEIWLLNDSHGMVCICPTWTSKLMPRSCSSSALFDVPDPACCA